jgi:molybdopterin-guanine dinucleotide biosynthesis protein A
VTKTRRPTEPRAIQERIAISILAGGQSRRMGRDKARLRFGRRTLLGHVRVAAAATGWPVRIIRRDAVPRCGPLGGIFTALSTSRGEAELFLACDMPFVSTALLLELAKRLGPGCDAVFAATDSGPGFPLLLRATALPAVERQIRARRFSVQALASVLGAKLFRPSKTRAIELVNINTPEEWEEARPRYGAVLGGVTSPRPRNLV